MTRDEIIKLAREASNDPDKVDAWQNGFWVINQDELERFATLIEQHLIASGYRKCAEGQRTTQFCGMVEEAVKAERQACKKVCELVAREIDDTNGIATYCGNVIESRGEVK